MTDEQAEDDATADFCMKCNNDWPCSTIRLLDELERVRAELVEAYAERDRLREALAKIHQPDQEEAEIWADGVGADRHAELFPLCVGECEGHTILMAVCIECGYGHDGDQPIYHSWPCPTIRAAVSNPTKELAASVPSPTHPESPSALEANVDRERIDQENL